MAETVETNTQERGTRVPDVPIETRELLDAIRNMHVTEWPVGKFKKVLEENGLSDEMDPSEVMRRLQELYGAEMN